MQRLRDILVVLIPGERAAGLLMPIPFVRQLVGGLFFGVHYLRKDQLHTFKKL